MQLKHACDGPPPPLNPELLLVPLVASPTHSSTQSAPLALLNPPDDELVSAKQSQTLVQA